MKDTYYDNIWGEFIMVFNMNLQDNFFNMVRNNSKTLEVRLLDDKRKALKIGDTIIFSNSSNQTIHVTIISLSIYNNFEELLQNNNPVEIGLINSSKKDTIEQLYSIYPEEKCYQYKVLAIKFKKNRDTNL